MEQHFPRLNLVGNVDEECIRNMEGQHLYSQGTDHFKTAQIPKDAQFSIRFKNGRGVSRVICDWFLEALVIANGAEGAPLRCLGACPSGYFLKIDPQRRAF